MITYGKRPSVAGVTESKSNFRNTSFEPQVGTDVVRVVVVAHRGERPRAAQLVGDEVVATEEQHLVPLDQGPQLGELVGVVLRGHGRLAQDQEAGQGDARCERERERRREVGTGWPRRRVASLAPSSPPRRSG